MPAVELISIEDAAKLSAEQGVPFLDSKWWNLQCIRKKLAASVVKHRRWVRKDRVQRVIDTVILEAST